MNARGSFRLCALLCLVPVMGVAQNTCETTNDQTNCVRVLACVGDSGSYFEGRSVGRGSGTMAGLIDQRIACTGTWTERNADGVGQVDVTCDDGMEVTVLYTYQEPYTGTAIGYGQANTGENITAWSGLHVLEYFQRETGEEAPNLPCGGPNSIPVS